MKNKMNRCKDSSADYQTTTHIHCLHWQTMTDDLQANIKCHKKLCSLICHDKCHAVDIVKHIKYAVADKAASKEKACATCQGEGKNEKNVKQE